MSLAFAFPTARSTVPRTFNAGGTATTASAGEIVCSLVDATEDKLGLQTYPITAAGTAWPWQVTFVVDGDYEGCNLLAEFFPTNATDPVDEAHVKGFKILDP